MSEVLDFGTACLWADGSSLLGWQLHQAESRQVGPPGGEQGRGVPTSYRADRAGGQEGSWARTVGIGSILASFPSFFISERGRIPPSWAMERQTHHG